MSNGDKSWGIVVEEMKRDSFGGLHRQVREVESARMGVVWGEATSGMGDDVSEMWGMSRKVEMGCWRCISLWCVASSAVAG